MQTVHVRHAASRVPRKLVRIMQTADLGPPQANRCFSGAPSLPLNPDHTTTWSTRGRRRLCIP